MFAFSSNGLSRQLPTFPLSCLSLLLYFHCEHNACNNSCVASPVCCLSGSQANRYHRFIVSTYPADPQARMGLARCMDALKRMEIVWPSAGRALELLAGSKFNLQEAELAKLSNHPDRRKRSAERDLDTEDIEAYDRGRLPNANADYLTLRSQDYDPSKYGNTQQEVFSDGVDMQSGIPYSNNVSYTSSYERWPLEGSVQHPFSGTLSTSVLPQLYSTGLVDEHATPGVRVYSNTYDRGGNGGGGGGGYEKARRYPQYWNDHTTFSQLGTAIGNPVPVQFDQQVQSQSIQPQANPSGLYLPEHYDMYSQ
jgi:hypothetical protein